MMINNRAPGSVLRVLQESPADPSEQLRAVGAAPVLSRVCRHLTPTNTTRTGLLQEKHLKKSHSKQFYKKG